jgi:phage gpG-like protein
MITVTITTDLQSLEDAVRRVTAARPAMQAIAEIIRGEALRNFREGGRYPSRWTPSARARKTGGRTLLDRGTLRNSITATATDSTAQAGTALKYAGIHQFGGTIRAKTSKGLRFKGAGKWANKREVTIPGRPFMPISSAGELSPEVMRRALNTLAKHITGATP